MEGGIFSHLTVFTDAHVIVRKRFFPSHFLSMHKRFNYKERRTHSSQSA